MEEFDVVSGGFNIKKPANNPPNSENSISLKKTMNSTCFALTHNVVLRFFSVWSKWSVQAWFELVF
jgi:hypothetical protein